MVICLERGADLHMAQLMPLPLTVSCSSKIQIGFTFLVTAYPGSPGKEAVKCMVVVVVTHGWSMRAGNGALGLHILTLEDRTLLLRGTQYLLWPGSICL